MNSTDDLSPGSTKLGSTGILFFSHFMVFVMFIDVSKDYNHLQGSYSFLITGTDFLVLEELSLQHIKMYL